MFRSAYASTPRVSFKRIVSSFPFIMLDQHEARAVTDFVSEDASVTTNMFFPTGL